MGVSFFSCLLVLFLSLMAQAQEDSKGPEGALDIWVNQERRSGPTETTQPSRTLGHAHLHHWFGGRTLLLETGVESTEFEKRPWVRERTRIVYHDPGSFHVATFGDFATDFRGFQNAFEVMGLSFVSSRGTASDHVGFRRGTYEIVISHPVSFEIYIGSQLFVSGFRESGVLDLRAFPLLRNRKNVRVRLTNEFGREEQFVFDFFSEGAPLASGKQEFSYQVGALLKENEEEEERSYDGQKILSTVSHRYGWNERLSLGLHYQNLTYHHLVGGDIATSQQSGVYSFEWGVSDVSSSRGFGGRLRWRGQGDESALASEVVYEERTEFFLPVRQEGVVLEKFRRRVDGNISSPWGDRNVVGLGASFQDGFLRVPSERILRADWMHYFRPALSLETSVYQRQHQTPESGTRLTLSWYETPQASSVSTRRDGVEDLSHAQLERPFRGDENDVMVRARWSEQPHHNQSWDSRLAIQSKWARIRGWSLQPGRMEGQDRLSVLGLDTSLQWGDSGLTLGTPEH